MEKLIYFWNHCLSNAINLTDTKAKKQQFYDQAYGVGQYYLMEHPGEEIEIYHIWENYRKEFIKEIYGYGA